MGIFGTPEAIRYFAIWGSNPTTLLGRPVTLRMIARPVKPGSMRC